MGSRIVDWNRISSQKSIVDILKRDTDLTEIKEPRTPGEPFSGSQVADLCPRQEALRSIHDVTVEESIDLLNKLYFTLGDGIHEAFQDRLLGERILGAWRCLGCGKVHGTPRMLAGEGDLVTRPERCDGRVWQGDGEWKECPNANWIEDRKTDHHLPGFAYEEIEIVHDDPPITAHPDAPIWVGNGPPEDGKALADEYVEIGELKSATDTVLEYGLRGSAPWAEEPWEKHVKQLQVYMYASGCERGRVIYINKGARKPEEMLIDHRVELDRELVENRLVELEMVDDAIEQEDATIAPRVCGSPDCSRAEDCPVSKKCWSLEKTDIEL